MTRHYALRDLKQLQHELAERDAASAMLLGQVATHLARVEAQQQRIIGLLEQVAPGLLAAGDVQALALGAGPQLRLVDTSSEVLASEPLDRAA